MSPIKTTVGYSMFRPLDRLGRVVVPKEIRNMLGWNEDSKIFIAVEDGAVLMRAFSSVCVVCKNPFNATPTQEICRDCIKNIKDKY